MVPTEFPIPIQLYNFNILFWKFSTFLYTYFVTTKGLIYFINCCLHVVNSNDSYFGYSWFCFSFAMSSSHLRSVFAISLSCLLPFSDSYFCLVIRAFFFSLMLFQIVIKREVIFFACQHASLVKLSSQWWQHWWHHFDIWHHFELLSSFCHLLLLCKLRSFISWFIPVVNDARGSGERVFLNLCRSSNTDLWHQ